MGCCLSHVDDRNTEELHQAFFAVLSETGQNDGVELPVVMGDCVHDGGGRQVGLHVSLNGGSAEGRGDPDDFGVCADDRAGCLGDAVCHRLGCVDVDRKNPH